MFPDFNIYSTPLLVLVTQGLILAFLLFNRYQVKRASSDFILALLLLITCYHRTTYTIGFMGWYDTFRNTKINYYLVSLGLAVGPLIYFYIKTSVQKNFKFKKTDFIHFVPVGVYVIFRGVVFLYDRMQNGFAETQNGPFTLWVMDHLWIIIAIIFAVHLLLYLIFSFILYFNFRKQLEQEYSNTYAYQLRWLRNFLIVFAFLFIYDVVQMLTDGFIFEMHWTQEWWYQFFSVLVVIYVGVMGYFTPLENLKKIEFSDQEKHDSVVGKTPFAYKEELQALCRLVEKDKLYLDPNLTLSQLSRMSRINTTQLSYMINTGLSKNFNDFINEYRVTEVKTQLINPDNKQFSILAIALDCGFNSKATFNRVFKRITGNSPSEFRKNI